MLTHETLEFHAYYYFYEKLNVMANRTMTTHDSINELIVSEDAIVSKVEERKNDNLHEDAIIVNRTMITR